MLGAIDRVVIYSLFGDNRAQEFAMPKQRVLAVPQSTIAATAARRYPMRLICGLFGGHRSDDATLLGGAMMGLRRPPSKKALPHWRTAYRWLARVERMQATALTRCGLIVDMWSISRMRGSTRRDGRSY